MARLDKWLWAARFFKTRAAAQQAVAGGKVRVNGERAKPAKVLRVGDTLDLQIGEAAWTLRVVQAQHALDAGKSDELIVVQAIDAVGREGPRRAFIARA